MADVRVTQAILEATADADTAVRVTQVALEATADATVNVQVTQVILEAMADDPDFAAAVIEVYYGFTQMPTHFVGGKGGSVTVRTRGANMRSADTLSLYAQIVQADESTPLSDEVLCITETGNDGWANHTANLTGVVPANRDVWNQALVRYRWSVS